MNGRVALVALGVVAAVGAVWWWPRTPSSPEAQVRALVAQCVTAAEKRDIATISDAVDDGFVGEGLSKPELKQMLLGHLMRNANTLVVLNPVLEVTATDRDASFSGVFVFARTREVNWQEPGDGVSRYDIEGTLTRHGERWAITSARWKR